MNTVTLSSKYQVVIPKEVRETVGLEAGTAFEIISYDHRIELIPLQPMKNLRGIFKEIDKNITRARDL
jgi:AbrB family looped-hinge helix DNA binding protein